MLRLERLLLLCLLAQLRASGTVPASKDPEVEVCVHLYASVPFELLAQSETTASELFEDIGVKIRWTCHTASRELLVRLRDHTPADLHPGSFGYALPYAHEGERVVVFYDRFERLVSATPGVAPIIFGHILAHEIGHVLAGVACHVESGLMRARWSDRDYSEMRMHRLGFSPEMGRFIYRNLTR